MFTDFVRQRLKRELLKDNPLFKSNILLSDRDRQRLLHARLLHAQQWRSPSELPAEGILVGQLRQLAYEMPVRRPEQEASQVRLNYYEALAILSQEHGKDLLKAAEAIGILDEDLGYNDVLFIHQLMPHYFGASIENLKVAFVKSFH